MISDARAIIDVLRDEVIRVGWTETERRSGVRRETLHRIFGTCGRRGSYPNLLTIACVASALGVKLEARRG